MLANRATNWLFRRRPTRMGNPPNLVPPALPCTDGLLVVIAVATDSSDPVRGVLGADALAATNATH
jgi:hypothetical protein